MAQNEVIAHIHVILYGTNYSVWSQSMMSFLKGRKLWLYVTGDIPKPTKVTMEMVLSVLVLLIGIANIIRFLRGFVTPPFPQLRHYLAVLMMLRVLGICLLLATPRLMVLESTRLFLIFIA
jgi:hypothetical protein